MRVRLALALLVAPCTMTAQQPDSARAAQCKSCAEWNAPQKPFRLFGNTFFLGTHGLSAILITSPTGDILIDGALPNRHRSSSPTSPRSASARVR